MNWGFLSSFLVSQQGFIGFYWVVFFCYNSNDIASKYSTKSGTQHSTNPSTRILVFFFWVCAFNFGVFFFCFLRAGPEVYRSLLSFMYTGRAEDLERLAEKLIFVAAKYQVLDLQKVCAQNLLDRIQPDNAARYLVVVDLLDIHSFKVSLWGSRPPILPFVVTKDSLTGRLSPASGVTTPYLFLRYKEGLVDWALKPRLWGHDP